MTAIDHVSGCATLPRGGALAFEIDGLTQGGVPLLLIRPLGGSMALWGRFRARLAEQVQVISFDLRGSGHSSPDPAWVSTEGLARDAIHLLDHLDVMRAHVFGVSLGGMAATWLAILAPTRVANLVLASAPARGLALTRPGCVVSWRSRRASRDAAPRSRSRWSIGSCRRAFAPIIPRTRARSSAWCAPRRRPGPRC